MRDVIISWGWGFIPGCLQSVTFQNCHREQGEAIQDPDCSWLRFSACQTTSNM